MPTSDCGSSHRTAPNADSDGPRYGRLTRISCLMVALALVSLPFADLEIYHVEPGVELARMAQGLLHPAWPQAALLVDATAHTIAFALLAVAGASTLGLMLALCFGQRWVRIGCAATRSVHELFWGLLLMQWLGLSPLTGILAIMIPYSGIFARVYAEILERQSLLPSSTLPPSSDPLSRHMYTLFAQASGELRAYTGYRFECALRSSAILGFIGLPTLGFHLESAFREGRYAEGSGIMLLFFALIASKRIWLRPRLLPVLLPLSFWLLPDSYSHSVHWWQFFSQDLWPAALREGDIVGAWRWYREEFSVVAVPALIDTLLLSQLALALSGVCALLCYGWACRALVSSPIYAAGHTLLLLMRSTPEIILAFILLLLLGPSSLPAVVALALHNGGLIAYLLAARADQIRLRADASEGINRFFYELTPRLYPGFLALLLYRWEIILRESAILGILGVTTLGFYIDSAFEDIRYDRAMFLILIAAVLNTLVDAFARKLRGYCQLKAINFT